MKKLIVVGCSMCFAFCFSVTQPTYANYDPSVMMPEAKLCPSKMSYYTACVQYGMGCNPDACHDSGEQ